MESNYNDLELNNEYLVQINTSSMFDFDSYIDRIKILKRTKNFTLIGIFNEKNNKLRDYYWKGNDDHLNIIEDLKIHVRQNKLNNL